MKKIEGGSFWPRFMVLAVVVLWMSLLGGNWVGRYVMEHNSKFVIKPDEYRPMSDQRSRLRGRPPVMPELGTPAPDKPAGDQSKDTKPAAIEKDQKLPPVADVPVGTENPDQRHPAASRPEPVSAPTESRPEPPPSRPEPATAPVAPGGDRADRPENPPSKPAPAAPVPTPERTSQPPAVAPPPPTPAGTGTEG